VVVASARHDTIDEAVWFVEQLVEQDVEVTSAIVNRAHPEFGEGSSADAAAAADIAAAGGEAALAALWRNVADLRILRERELEVVGPLADIAGEDRVTVLPLLDRDVHDLDGLRTIAAHLFDHPIAER
jgi:anion-transporting  ArsA/GET3 family ATPase